MKLTVTRSIVTAGASIGFGIAMQPVLAQPEVLYIATRCAEVMLLSGGAMGLTLGIGYVNHQLQTWALERPVMPAPMTQFAVTLPGGPALAGQMAQAQAEERRTDEDDVERQWRNAVVRFCVIGMTYGDMGYPRMKHHVDRTGWDTITRELESAKVLRIGAGRRPTQFAAGWDLPRLRVSIKREWITLPCPAPDEIPVVKW